MLFPIPGVPISIEIMKAYRTRPDNPSEEAPKHWARTLRSVWRRIPRVDREIMVADIGKYNDSRLSVWFITNWLREYDTNAFIQARRKGIIGIDAGYARSADSVHLGATIAHELAHYRDFAGDNKSDLTEATARNIAECAWGFPRGEVIYKCEECRQIDAVLRERGITGGVFWHACFGEFVYLRDKRRIQLWAASQYPDYHFLNVDAEDSLINVLDSDVILSFRSKADKVRHRAFRRRQREEFDRLWSKIGSPSSGDDPDTKRREAALEGWTKQIEED
jgi:hypothetical protein